MCVCVCVCVCDTHTHTHTHTHGTCIDVRLWLLACHAAGIWRRRASACHQNRARLSLPVWGGGRQCRHDVGARALAARPARPQATGHRPQAYSTSHLANTTAWQPSCKLLPRSRAAAAHISNVPGKTKMRSGTSASQLPTAIPRPHGKGRSRTRSCRVRACPAH